jgi:HEAT repeat protein
MRNSLRKGCVLTLVGILFFVVVRIWDPFEPRYQGRRLSAWAKDVHSSDEDYYEKVPSLQTRLIEIHEKHEKAITAIQHIGVRALPTALRLCQAKDSWIKMKLGDWAEERNLRIHYSSAQDKQIEGETIIRALGPTAKPIIPDLIELFQNEYPMVADVAMYALQGIGPDAVAPLIEAMTNSNSRVRMYAAGTLGLFGSQARVAVPGLLAYLKDKDLDARMHAAESLGRIGANATVAVPALVRCLEEEKNYRPRSYYPSPAIIRAIGRFGTNAQPAVPTLIRIIESKQRGFMSALSALHKIDPQTAKICFNKLQVSQTNQSSPSP